MSSAVIGQFSSLGRLVGLFSLLVGFLGMDAIAQNFGSMQNSRNFQTADAIVRVAEPGQLADTIMVWGDVTMPGTFLVPRGTRLMEIISYAKGPRGFSSVETQLDWSKMRVSLVLNPTDGRPVQRINLRYDEPLDPYIRDTRLRNMDVVAFQVKRKAIFTDYVRVAGPLISIALTTTVLVRTWK
jgi:hypothetical protein